MVTDATDATFEQDVLVRSESHPVVVDLWASWCGPCKTLGPMLESAVNDTDGVVELVKIDVDQNPNTSQAFNVQSIPAVFALKDRRVVDSFIGAIPESGVRDFVNGLVSAPTEEDLLVEKGDEASLRAALELAPDHAGAIIALASLLVERHEPSEALDLLSRLPESAEVRHIAALARLETRDLQSESSIEEQLDALLDRVKTNDGARQEFIDLLETLEENDPRRAQYRRALSSRLF